MIESFVLKLVTGIALMWLLMPRKDVTDGFFRIQMLVALGLSVLLVLTIQPISPPSQPVVTQQRTHISDAPISNVRTQTATDFFRITQIIAAVIAYAGHIVWKLGRRIPGAIAIYSVAGLCLIGLVTNSFDTGVDVNTTSTVLFALHVCSSVGGDTHGHVAGALVPDDSHNVDRSVVVVHQSTRGRCDWAIANDLSVVGTIRICVSRCRAFAVAVRTNIWAAF